MLDAITSGLVGVSSRDIFQSTTREAEVINWVQFLQCLPQKIYDSQKIAQNFSTFIANISGTDQNINKKLSYCWETVRRESMPTIAEIDAEMTT